MSRWSRSRTRRSSPRCPARPGSGAPRRPSRSPSAWPTACPACCSSGRPGAPPARPHSSELVAYEAATHTRVIAITDEPAEQLTAFFKRLTTPFPRTVAIDEVRRAFPAHGLSGPPSSSSTAPGIIRSYSTGYDSEKGLGVEGSTWRDRPPSRCSLTSIWSPATLVRVLPRRATSPSNSPSSPEESIESSAEAATPRRWVA